MKVLEERRAPAVTWIAQKEQTLTQPQYSTRDRRWIPSWSTYGPNGGDVADEGLVGRRGDLITRFKNGEGDEVNNNASTEQVIEHGWETISDQAVADSSA